jgi:glycosyltransferase involved in cell wall biosynthesis
MLSIICPIYNEEKYIRQFLDSLLKQDYPKEDMEILLVDGMSKDRTREIVAGYTAQFPFIHLVDNPERIVPYAMNRGIEAAKGEVIIRLDAHAEYPKNYFTELVNQLFSLEGAENVGGVCVTLPCNDSSKAIAIAECLSNKFGMGNSYFRVGSNEVMSVDTVPFGCFRRSLFDRIGMYDLELVRNQDDELNGRIIKNGGKIYLLPQLEIKYFARDKIKKVWNMFYQYGLYKPLVNKKLGSPATIRQFFPLAFVIGLYVGFVLSIFFPVIRYMYIAVLLLHFGIGLAIGCNKARKWDRISLMMWMPLIFFIIHYAYGWGYIKGIFKIITKQPFNVESNR